jgi:hypothetical protein
MLATSRWLIWRRLPLPLIAGQDPVSRLPSLSSPSLTDKYLRFADRVGGELGVSAALKEFEEKAAAFPSPPHIRVATYVHHSLNSRVDLYTRARTTCL